METKLKSMINLNISKTSMGYVVYDPEIKDHVDIFPYTNEGYERLINFLKENLSQDVCPYFKK